ncbi:MAG: ATP-binding cassette domain-containing protein, partial [Conexivisphaerales archaeon]
NLLFAARLYHLPDYQSRVRIGEMLSLIDLEGAAERKVKTYSGGMRRRLQLAMGLIHSPRILFLDEPTIGLDIQTRKKVHEYIRGLNREQGLTVFMTTHYLEEADELSQRIGIIDEGRIKALNSPSALKSEMGTQILVLQVSAAGEDLTEFLKSVPDVTEVTKRGPGLYEVGLSKVEDAIPVIVDGTVRRELRILDLSVVKPSLEQVFLQLTGHSLRDSEALSNVYGQKLQIERMK